MAMIAAVISYSTRRDVALTGGEGPESIGISQHTRTSDLGV